MYEAGESLLMQRMKRAAIPTKQMLKDEQQSGLPAKALRIPTRYRAGAGQQRLYSVYQVLSLSHEYFVHLPLTFHHKAFQTAQFDCVAQEAG